MNDIGSSRGTGGRMGRSKSRRLGFLLLMLLFTATCHLHDDPVQNRVSYAEKGSEEIHLGVVWPFSPDATDPFRQGVSLALDEINGAGGLLGRKVVPVFRDDLSSTRQGLVVARDFADDAAMLFVIGHCDLNVFIPASLVYQVNGILCITPGTTGSKMARRGLDLVFNTYHTDLEISGSLADYCNRRSYRRMAVVFQSIPYGSGLLNAFEERAGELGINVVARLPYDRPDRRLIGDMASALRYSEAPDAIFVAGMMPGVAKVVAGLRETGVELPIVGTDDLDSDEFFKVAGDAAEGTVIPSAFDLGSPRPEVGEFARRFETAFQRPPDTWAAQGYDAVRLLAHAVDQAKSTVPAKVAAALGQTRNWPGVTGLHTFNADGEVTGKPFVLKQVRGGRFVFLEEVVSVPQGEDR